MADEKKIKKDKVMVAEFNVSMYCNACERTVAKVISKIKGVETFTTDMNKHRVKVKGKINPDKILKKLRKKTGKKVEIVIDNKEDQEKDENKEKENPETAKQGLSDDPLVIEFFGGSKLCTMFDEENPNACSVM